MTRLAQFIIYFAAAANPVVHGAFQTYSDPIPMELGQKIVVGTRPWTDTCLFHKDVKSYIIQKWNGSSWSNIITRDHGGKVLKTVSVDGDFYEEHYHYGIYWNHSTPNMVGMYRSVLVLTSHTDQEISHATLPIIVANSYKNWPHGEFYLQSTNTGCPTISFGVTWKETLRPHLTMSQINATSPGAHFPNDVILGGHVVEKLCVADRTGPLNDNDSWPAGSYCLGKKTEAACPSGFSEGVIMMFDVFPFHATFHPNRGLNPELFVSEFPDVLVDFQNINFPRELEFCCRSDGSPSTAIFLPNTGPFYLYANGNTCQKVYLTRTTMESLTFDTDDNRENVAFGAVPKHDKLREVRNSSKAADNLRIYYCYYEFTSDQTEEITDLEAYTDLIRLP